MTTTTLAERLRRARGRAFAGRAAEPAHFRHLLRGEPDGPAVLFLPVAVTIRLRALVAGSM
ncbi:hypothetical protein [Actinoplanes italicus]|uniref:Uncharacterized protein n=1 Tax=Actinoplanes italicus TaxID=113567 RepID=A0A2T0JLF2_9ACTN|nr:hypothetical protein [Actinoplanes italicus]PRX08423.1 hypothetical protein CLV67_14022 [Actinoplanes italicus]